MFGICPIHQSNAWIFSNTYNKSNNNNDNENNDKIKKVIIRAIAIFLKRKARGISQGWYC